MPRPPTGAPNGRPPRTSRAQILAAARRLIDRDGWERLTIRALAAEAGTSPATVYYHVRDKDDLLIQLLNDYADQIPRPALPRDPREKIAAAATVIHDVLAAWPWVAEVLTADDLLGDSALWLVEAILDGAADAGCDPEAAVRLYRNVWYYTVGEILVRARRARRREQVSGPAYREQSLARLDPAAYPRLTGLAARWPALTSQDTYAEGLRALIDGALQPSYHLKQRASDARRQDLPGCSRRDRAAACGSAGECRRGAVNAGPAAGPQLDLGVVQAVPAKRRAQSRWRPRRTPVSRRYSESSTGGVRSIDISM